jgi:hypothetical protein
VALEGRLAPSPTLPLPPPRRPPDLVGQFHPPVLPQPIHPIGGFIVVTKPTDPGSPK